LLHLLWAVTAPGTCGHPVEWHRRYLVVLPLPEGHHDRRGRGRDRGLRGPPPATDGSVTWDRGVGIARYANFAAATGLPLYSCDAY
jgi:IS30 family transposase